ncbi:MAG: hypothetical protein PVS2B2_10660 [Candidatus Acidiferrum sp.]
MWQKLDAAFGKEGEEEGGGFLGEDAGGDFHMVIEAGLGKDFEAGTDGAAFGFIGAIDQPSDARLDHGASAHNAGFEGDVEGGTGKAIVLEETGSFTKNDDFGVSGGIGVANGAIAGAGENFAFVNEDGADRNFTGSGGGAGFVQGEAHEMNVVVHAG